MKFGLYHLVVLDDSTPFKGSFIAMCQALNLNYDFFAKQNHKEGLSVENFHPFLNKSVTIAAEERGTTNIFVPVGIAVGYAWNSVPINGTDILRSIPAIGRQLKFSLDINLNAILKLVQNNANAVLGYLKLTDSSRSFSSSILKIIIEDRRISYDERINNSTNLVVLHAGDIVMARTAVQCDLSKHKVAKLNYSVRGPFQIIRNTWFGSYFVQKLNKLDSPELKFMAYDLYPLSPSLKPCESVDSIDTRYLNHMHTPLINPLKRTFDIELYNEQWFNKPLHTSTPKLVYDHDTLNFPGASFPVFPSVSELHQETNTCPPTLSIEPDNYSLSSLLSPLTLHRSLSNFDCLFFICYIPENTFKPCWFLVQINHAETTLLDLD